ncbi:MAG: PASTA domain-containing protein, partial [Oscillospiraceae bacterium]
GNPNRVPQGAKVTPPPQQKFVSASDTPKTPTQPQVQGNPNRVPQGAKVTPPPQQKFVSASDTPKTPTQPQVQGNPNRVPQGAKVTPPPQQKFVSASDTPKTPTQPQVQGNPNRVPQGAKVTPPPQQRFVSASDTPKTPTQPQVQGNSNRTKTTSPMDSKPASVPKPSTTTVEMVKVPDITNRNQDEARTQLEKLGLKVSISTDNSAVVKPNLVMSQSIRTGTEVVKGSEIKLVVSVGSWSKWSTDKIIDNAYIVEQKKEFRYRTRTKEIETHESSEKNLPGYTCIDQKKIYSDWVNEGYFTTEHRPTSETCDISTNLLGFKYCGYTYVGNQFNIDMCYSTKKTALIFNPETKPEDWQYMETVLYQDILGKTEDWFPNDDAERKTPAGDKIDCNIKMTTYFADGKRYAMKFGSLSTEWYLYHSRTEMETIYTYKREYFTDWSEWSDWTDKAPQQDELNEVEARILYRARRKTSKDKK